MKNNKFFVFILALVTSLFTSVCFAKSLNLYDQPKADGKVIGSIDSDAGVIPIFTPKDNSDWIKVADPRNGNVGWVKQADLKASKVTFTQQIINTGNSPHSYEIIQFGGTQSMTPEQKAAAAKRMEENQKAIEQSMHQLIDNLSKGFNQAVTGMPVIMPVIIVPEQKKEAVPATKK